MSNRSIGVSVSRIDGPEKVHGAARFTDDYRPPGLLHAALLPSPYAHARIVKIDTSRARSAAGVRGAFTG